MKKLILIALAILTLGCSPIRRVITEYKTEYVVKDSISIRDSVRITDKERVVDVVAVYDTLHLETSLAKATAYLDTSIHMLRGTLENKQQIIYKYKYIDRWHTKDSLVYVEKEVPVDKIVKVKNKTNGFLLGWFIASLLAIVVFILKKFHIFF